METTIMENQMEKKMENEMETGIIIFSGQGLGVQGLGIRDLCLGFRVQGLGFRGLEVTV